jgi:hypothetical protein
MKLLFAIIALAIGTSAALAGHTSCQTFCNQNTGYCSTSCYNY